MQMLFSFCEMYKRISYLLLNLFYDDRRESIPKVINYICVFYRNCSKITTDVFSPLFPIEKLDLKVAIML